MHVMWECFVLMIPNILYVYCNSFIEDLYEQIKSLLICCYCDHVCTWNLYIYLWCCFIHTFSNMVVTFFSESSWGRREIFSLKAKDRQLDSIVITGGIVSCHYVVITRHKLVNQGSHDHLGIFIKRSHSARISHRSVIWRLTTCHRLVTGPSFDDLRFVIQSF